MKNNPFLTTWTTLYQVPPFNEIETLHFLPAIEAGIEAQNKEILAIIENNAPASFANTIAALDDSGELLDKVTMVFFNLLETNSNDEMQELAEIISEKLSIHADNIAMNDKLFKRIEDVVAAQESLNEEEERLLLKTYKDFVRGGAKLNPTTQNRFREINKEIANLTLKFNNNVLAATNAYKLIIDNTEDLSGLPENVILAAQETAKNEGLGNNKWVFTLDNPSLLPFLQYAKNRTLRQQIWSAYASRCNGGKFDNNKIINQLVNLRIERAKLLGYDRHADFVLDENMAKTPQAAYDLLLQVWKPALEKAKEERDCYQLLAGNEKIEPWDWRYYAEQMRQKICNMDEDKDIRPYFALKNVLNGAFLVAKKLYGISFEQNFHIPTYDPMAEVYEVKEDEKVIGILYMDFFIRNTKGSGAWMTEFRGQHQTTNGENVLPIISVVCNFPPPTTETPSLLNIDEVETLFHEFGHALHGLLSQCRYKSMAGTNVSRDFVELPSQIMENWATEPQILKLYAKHYKTQEPIPDETIEKIAKSKRFGQGFLNTELIAASLLDMDYHTLTSTQEIIPSDFETESMKHYGLIEEIIPRYHSQYFKHIFTSAMGYSAGYYGYTWSAVLDADAFDAFKEKGLFDQQTANNFRKYILEKGNSVDAMEAFVRFRGRKPSIKPLLKRQLNIENE